MKHKIPQIVLAGAMVCSMVTGPFTMAASAAEKNSAPSLANNSSSTTANESTVSYPINIQYPTDDSGLIAKTYEVKTEDAIGLIERTDVTYRGRVYQFQDIYVEAIPFHDEKPYVEVVTGESESKDVKKIIATLEDRREITTDDGYTGILTLDEDSLTTEATGYGTSQKTKNVTRSYTGLSDADLTYIPKTVTESGVTYSLTDVKWAEFTANNPYDSEMATRFNATATYTGTYSVSYAKGYTYEVKYTGNVVKDEIKGYRCTMLFAPVIDEDNWYDVFVGDSANPVAIALAVILLMLLAASIAFAVHYLLKKTKGEEEVMTTEEYYDGDTPREQ